MAQQLQRSNPRSRLHRAEAPIQNARILLANESDGTHQRISHGRWVQKEQFTPHTTKPALLSHRHHRQLNFLFSFTYLE